MGDRLGTPGAVGFFFENKKCHGPVWIYSISMDIATMLKSFQIFHIDFFCSQIWMASMCGYKKSRSFLSTKLPIPPPKCRNPKSGKELIVTLISVTICKFDIFFCKICYVCVKEAGISPLEIVVHKIILIKVNLHWLNMHLTYVFFKLRSGLYTSDYYFLSIMKPVPPPNIEIRKTTKNW